MMEKYVVYYHEFLNEEHTKEREFFKVEKHPKLGDKPWISSKSGKIPLLDKLTQTNKVVRDLLEDVYPEKDASKLPKYFAIQTCHGRDHLVFEKRREDKTRMNLKMVLSAEMSMEEQLVSFQKKVHDKYPDFVFL